MSQKIASDFRQTQVGSSFLHELIEQLALGSAYDTGLIKLAEEEGMSIEDVKALVDNIERNINDLSSVLSCKLKAPIFLRDMYGDMGVTCMCCGFEVGPGWLDTVCAFCKKVEELNNSNPGMSVVADQIKQKFGDLTVYSHYEGDVDDAFKAKFKALLKEAEDACSETCELCGKPAEYISSSWIRPVCDACSANDIGRYKLS